MSHLCNTNQTTDVQPSAIQLVKSNEALERMQDKDAMCLKDAPLPVGNMRITLGYVCVIHCQGAQMPLGLSHT